MSALLFVLRSDNRAEIIPREWVLRQGHSGCQTMSEAVDLAIERSAAWSVYGAAALPRKGAACNPRPRCFPPFRSMRFHAALFRKPAALSFASLLYLGIKKVSFSFLMLLR